jgi:hypothetical protein
MKISSYLLMLSLLLVAACARQKSVNPSPEVFASFETRFGKDVNTNWELSPDKSYVANLTISGHPIKAYFEANGRWVKSETEFISSELPSVIVKTVLGAYRGYTISKSLKIDEIEKETVYRLSLKRGGNITDVDLTPGGVILGTPMLR